MSRSDRVYRALIVGCGRIAAGYSATADDPLVVTHAMAYRRHPRFDLVACVEPDRDLREAFRAHWGVASGHATLDAALADVPDVDVVSVCSPTATHVEVLERLLAAPVRAVFAEKPLGGDPVRAAEIVARYRAAGRPLAVAFPRRWDGEIAALKAEIARGDWGRLRTAVALYGRGVVNNASHHLDLVDHLFGERLDVVAVGGVLADGVDGDPSVDATLRLAGGARVHLVAADGRDHSCFELTLVFERGIVALEERGLFIRRRPVAPSGDFVGMTIVPPGEPRPTGYGTALLAALDDIVAAIETGRAPASSGDTALVALRLANELRTRAAGLRAA